MKIFVDGNVHTAGKPTVEGCMTLAKLALTGKNAIYAVKKDDYVEMRKDVYPTKAELDTAIEEWGMKGFIVYSIQEGKE